MAYSERCTEERAMIQVSLEQDLSIRKVADLLERSPSTISREMRRNKRTMVNITCRMRNGVAISAR